MGGIGHVVDHVAPQRLRQLPSEVGALPGNDRLVRLRPLRPGQPAGSKWTPGSRVYGHYLGCHQNTTTTTEPDNTDGMIARRVNSLRALLGAGWRLTRLPGGGEPHATCRQASASTAQTDPYPHESTPQNRYSSCQ